MFDDQAAVDDHGADVGSSSVQAEGGYGMVAAEVMQAGDVDQHEVGKLTDLDLSQLLGQPEARPCTGGHG